MKITMQLIADKAGVTRATVDKVIHDRPGVSKRTKERVKQVIAEYGYKPNTGIKTKTLQLPSTKIAIVTLPPSHDYYMSELKAGMDQQIAAFKEIGMNAEYYYCDSSNPQSMISIIEYLKNCEIDALAIRGINYPEINQYVKSLTEKNIPVITFDSDLSDSERLCFVGENLEETGQIAASLLAKSIGGAGEIAVLGSSMNVNSTLSRIKGFVSYIREHYPDIVIVDVVETLDQHSITYSKVSSLLKEYPDLKGIWNSVSCCEDMAQAVIDEKKAGKVKLVTLTFSPSIISLIKDNIIDFTIGLTSFKLGKIVIQTLYNYIYLHKSPASKHIQTPIYIALDANIHTFSGTHPT